MSERNRSDMADQSDTLQNLSKDEISQLLAEVYAQQVSYLQPWQDDFVNFGNGDFKRPEVPRT